MLCQWSEDISHAAVTKTCEQNHTEHYKVIIVGADGMLAGVGVVVGWGEELGDKGLGGRDGDVGEQQSANDIERDAY